nr:PREDICTED: E3 ubiquitin-protein ligase RNF167-like [Phalacrocorax carbo]
MAGSPTLSHAHTASSALSPPHRRAEAPPAQRGGHKVTTTPPGSGAMAPDNEEIKGGAMVAFMEGNMRLQRKTYQAEQGTIILLDERCFWNDVPYEPGKALKLLSCSHDYQGKCINPGHCAQPGSKTCPLCLHSVTAEWLWPPAWSIAVCCGHVADGEPHLSCLHVVSKMKSVSYRYPEGVNLEAMCMEQTKTEEKKLRKVGTAFYKAALAEGFAYVSFNNSSRCVAYKALPACFGPQLPAEGLTGYLMRVMPPNACRAIGNPPAPRKASETYIALIQGYNCSLVEKVLHAQQAGYQTAVVYNVDSEQLVTMMTDDKEIQQLIKIPSLLTGQSASLHLQRTLQCKKGAYISLLPPKHYLSSCQGNAKMLQQTSIVQDFRDIFYVIIATISVMLGLSWYKRACKIKLHTYKQGDKYETCVICMAEYKEGDCLKILSCSHAYHRACIDSWFNTQPRKKICPFCKQVVNTYGQGDLLPEQTDEGVNEEEEDQEENVFREGHEDECVGEDDASTVEGEGFDAMEKAPFEL